MSSVVPVNPVTCMLCIQCPVLSLVHLFRCETSDCDISWSTNRLLGFRNICVKRWLFSSFLSWCVSVRNIINGKQGQELLSFLCLCWSDRGRLRSQWLSDLSAMQGSWGIADHTWCFFFSSYYSSRDWMLECLESEGSVHMRIKCCYFLAHGEVPRKPVLFTAAYLLGLDSFHIDRNSCFILKGE